MKVLVAQSYEPGSKVPSQRKPSKEGNASSSHRRLFEVWEPLVQDKSFSVIISNRIPHRSLLSYRQCELTSHSMTFLLIMRLIHLSSTFLAVAVYLVCYSPSSF